MIEEADTSDIPPEEVDLFRDQLAFFSRFTSQGGAKFQSILRKSQVGIIGEGNLSRSVLRHLNLSGFGEVVILGSDAAQDNHNQEETVPGGFRSKLQVLPLDRNSIWSDDKADHLPELFFLFKSHTTRSC